MSKEANYIDKVDSKIMLKLYIQPGSKKSELVGLYGEPPRLKIKIKSQPQDGEANAEVITFLAKLFRIPKGKVEIKRGHTSRQKDVLIEMDFAKIELFLNILLI